MLDEIVVHINVYSVIRECFNVSLSVQFMHMLQCIRKVWQWFNHVDQHLCIYTVHISKNASLPKPLRCSVSVWSSADLLQWHNVPYSKEEEVSG